MNLDIQQKSKIWESPLKVLGGLYPFLGGWAISRSIYRQSKNFRGIQTRSTKLNYVPVWELWSKTAIT